MRTSRFAPPQRSQAVAHAMQRKTNQQEDATRGAFAPTNNPIQRSVDNFASTSTNQYGPFQKIYAALYARRAWLDDDFSTSNAIKEQMNRSLKGQYNQVIPRTTKVEADIDNTTNDTNPDRDSANTGRMGHFAHDSLFLNRAIKEPFEGGHLIGHRFWDDNDADKDSAGTGDNVVGMSRAMNMGIYKPIEDKLADTNTVNDITIDVAYGADMSNSLDMYAMDLGIDIDDDHETDLQGVNVSMKDWVPKSVKLSAFKPNNGMDQEMDAVSEPARHKTMDSLIGNRGQLRQSLIGHGIWRNVAVPLQNTLVNGGNI